MEKGTLKLQLIVFALVSASFTNVYLTQPVLPVIQNEFNVNPVQVSLTISAVIFGIVLSNLFFGFLSDRFPIHPIISAGGLCVAIGGLVSATTHNFIVLIAARFFQGIFIPALTTSLAAWLARTLPKKRLNVVMGSYVSATILGGLGGRLLGGWIHPPLHWRYAFFSASAFIAATTFIALIALPRIHIKGARHQDMNESFISLLKRKDLILVLSCGAAGLLMFSPIFNFLPYRLADAPFHFSTEMITMVYLVYILGIFLVFGYGYNINFLVVVALALLGAGVIFMPDAPTGNTGDGRQGLGQDLFEAGRLLADKKMAATLLFAFVVICAVSLRGSFLPVYLRSLGLSEADIGTLIGVFAASSTAIRYFIGRIMSILKRRWIMLLSTVLAAIGVGSLPALTQPWLLALSIGVFGIGIGFTQPLTMIMVADLAAEGRSGLVMGLRYTMITSANLLGPIGFGYVVQVLNLASSFYMAAILVAAVGLFLSLARPWIIPERQ